MPLTDHYGNSYFDFRDFNNEATTFPGTYFFKREADSDKYITIRRIRLLYRNLGTAVINLELDGQNEDGSLNRNPIGNFSLGGASFFSGILWTYTKDFVMTVTTPQLSIFRVSGPISIIRVTLMGDGKQMDNV